MEQNRAVRQFVEIKKWADKTNMRLAAEDWDAPWKTLISTMLSAQTRDETTIEVSEKLFKKYKTAKALGSAKLSDVENIISRVNFFKTKAKHIIATCQIIAKKIPDTIPDLVKLPGVGIKTASVYVTEIYGADAIPVDTHVFRIARKLGWAKSKYPEKVGEELMDLFPKMMWNKINPTLVRFGKEYGRSSRQEDEILKGIRML